MSSYVYVCACDFVGVCMFKFAYVFVYYEECV